MTDPTALLDDCLRQAGWDPARCHLTPMAGATVNRLFRVSREGGDAVLRLHGNQSGFAVSREQEAKAWRAAAAIQRAPALIHWAPDHRFCLSEFAGEAVELPAVAPLVSLLADLHRLPLGLPVIAPSARIVHYLAGAAPVPLRGYLARIPQWTEQLHSSALPPGFCHHDLHRGNLRRLSSGRYLALDFEYAGSGHPLMDLVTAAQDGVDPEALWRGYLACRGVAVDEHEHLAWRAAQALTALMTLAWLVRIHHGSWPQSEMQWAPQWRPWWRWATAILEVSG